MGSESGTGEYVQITTKLQKAMYDYGIYLRRKKCNDIISNMSATDVERCKHFRQLFVMKYFTEPFTEVDSEALYMEKYENNMREMHSGNNKHLRDAEIARTRTASMALSRNKSPESKASEESELDGLMFSIKKSGQVDDNDSVGDSIASGIGSTTGRQSLASREQPQRARTSSRQSRRGKQATVYEGERDKGIVLIKQILLPDLDRRKARGGKHDARLLFRRPLSFDSKEDEEDVEENESFSVTTLDRSLNSISLTCRERSPKPMVVFGKPRSSSASTHVRLN